MTQIAVNTLIEEAKLRLKTLRDVLRFGISLFNQHHLYYGHGTTNVYDEVVYLILHSLNLPLDVLEPYLEATLLDSEINLILDRFYKRAVESIPAPYITNEAIVQGYAFYIDKRAIIPRSFIPEIILDDGLMPWVLHAELVHNILDLCTGNGSIAIIAADYFTDSHVVAVDIDVKALEVAAINIEQYALQGRITLLESDLWNNVPLQKFDLILTNPPYVDQLRMDSLNREYLYEPQHALFGGESGLDLVDQILVKAANYLTDDGVLVVEMGDNREELEEVYSGLPFTWLDTKSGEGFVFVLTAKQLQEYFI